LSHCCDCCIRVSWYWYLNYWGNIDNSKSRSWELDNLRLTRLKTLSTPRIHLCIYCRIPQIHWCMFCWLLLDFGPTDQLNSSMSSQLPLFYSLNDGKYNDVSNISLEINLPSKATLKLLYISPLKITEKIEHLQKCS